jgi:phosphonate transport system permease protein
MSTTDAPTASGARTTGRSWRKPPMIRSAWLRWGLLIATIAYLIYAIDDVNFDLQRFIEGIPRAVDMAQQMVPPDFSRWQLLLDGVLESLQMAIFATAVGVVLSIPIAVCAARNMVPKPVYLAARGYLGIVRTLPEVLIAIFLVKAFGFGAFAGMLTLTIASTGFVGKLLAEDIEQLDPGQVEAIRATGGNWLKVLLYGVAPQTLPRYIGLCIYRLDINLRESTILGIVGAGGIGATLYNSFGRYEYDFSFAILLSIIAIVLVAEWASGAIRARIT